MILFCIGVGVIAAVALLLWSVDFYYFLVNRFCRYHIGRWPSNDIWRQAVLKRAIRWVYKTPTVKITDNNRYILIDKFQGRFRSHSIQSWQTASLLLGLEHYGSTESLTAARIGAEKLLDEDGMFRIKPTNVDCGMQAYSLMQLLDAEKIRPAMDYAATLIYEHIAQDGTLVYTNDISSDERYVDTVGLACPFLARYGTAYGKPEYAELAVKQLRAFTAWGLEPNTQLPNHAYSASSKLPLGVYGWGRGAGWYTLGLIDTFKALPEGEDKEWLKRQIAITAEAYLHYQRLDGGFGYIMQLQKGYDSSATAALAYFYRECAIIFDSADYNQIADRCINKLQSVTRINGAIDWCQGDTKEIGVFSQTFDIMPFAQGMVLRAFNYSKGKE